MPQRPRRNGSPWCTCALGTRTPFTDLETKPAPPDPDGPQCVLASRPTSPVEQEQADPVASRMWELLVLPRPPSRLRSRNGVTASSHGSVASCPPGLPWHGDSRLHLPPCLALQNWWAVTTACTREPDGFFVRESECRGHTHSSPKPQGAIPVHPRDGAKPSPGPTPSHRTPAEMHGPPRSSA